MSHDHFKGRGALEHMVEVQAEGKIISSEIHGAETPGYLFAACDAAREIAVFLVVLVLILSFFEFAHDQVFIILFAFSAASIFWKIGRAAWLSWSRLERLHRVMNEERYEIEHNRTQEKQELKALYQAKGFQGKLLDEVVDVLMADGDRALRVMLEEEMGFRLDQNEHPLIQGLGAGLGALIAAIFALLVLLSQNFSLFIAQGILVVTFSCFVTARREHNRVIPAVIWNVGIGLFASLVAFYTMHYISG
ncbi:MAG: VIT1/CCC1 transporter family protein [Chlamydiales bacterium]|nr:VIT1/CCC1 transporter family protein [Chlamydiales bacterium]